jgi:hypothetical protein
MESLVGSSCSGPFPLDPLDFVCLVSSFGCSGSFVGSYSSSTCNVLFLYFGVYISSTSTTMGILFVLVCGTRVLLRVFHPVLLGAPTLSGDMVRKSELQASKSTNGSENSHFFTLPLGSAFFSLENNTMGRFPPFF